MGRVQPRRRGRIPLLHGHRVAGAVVCVVVAMIAAVAVPAETENEPILFPVRLSHPFPDHQETFREVVDLILKHYYTGDLDEKALYWAAIEGMLRHISPPENPKLCRIWSQQEFEQIRQNLQGEQVSIGIKSRFNPQEGSLTVTDVMPESPAEDILRPMDRILRIDGLSLKGVSLSKINALLSGEEGKVIALTVNRDIKVFEVSLQCQRFEQEDLIVTPLDRKVALVEIRQFTSGMAADLKKQLAPIADNGVRNLIIDLRNTPGGVLLEALRIAELFLPKDRILLRTYQRDARVRNYVSANAHPLSFDIALLVNEKTASSAEVLSAALQDNQAALVVGTRTYGKGIFEKTFPLKNGMQVKFITGAMVSPKGNSWYGRGIRPDFLVQQEEKSLAALKKLPPEERFTRDVSIITAYKLLRRLAR